MLSRPDFIEKQIVVITAEEFKEMYLQNDNIVIKENDKIVSKVSCFKIFCIFIIGDFSITSKLITKLLKYQISIYCLGYNLKPKFLVGGQLEGNFILRAKQYGQSGERELIKAKHIIKNKANNQLLLLKDIRKKDEDIKKGIKQIKGLIKKIDYVDNDDSLRGIEGSISKIYFQNYFREIKRYKRAPRTKMDIPNLLMDIGYTYLYNFVEANLNLYGFDIYKGVYHKLFFERKSLVCDLVEPFRCIIDKKIRKSYNINQINAKDFKFIKGAYILPFNKAKDYTRLFLEELIYYKLDIFDYIKQYYRCIIKGIDEYPTFTLGEK